MARTQTTTFEARCKALDIDNPQKELAAWDAFWALRRWQASAVYKFVTCCPAGERYDWINIFAGHLPERDLLDYAVAQGYLAQESPGSQIYISTGLGNSLED